MIRTSTRLIPLVAIGGSVCIGNNSSNNSNRNNCNKYTRHSYIDHNKYISYADTNNHHDYSGVAIISGTSSSVLSNAVASHLGTNIIHTSLQQCYNY